MPQNEIFVLQQTFVESEYDGCAPVCCVKSWMRYVNTYRVIQSIDVQHHSLGPLVVGAQEEVGFTLAGGSCCLGLLGLFFTSRLQNLIDLRGQQFGLSRRRTPLVREKF